jgi:hypothetical protein
MLKLVALSVLLTTVISTRAQSYSASLDAAQDGGGGRTGTGSASLTLSGSSLSWHVTYTGLSSPSSAAHIHGPAAVGVNAPVLFPFTGTFGTTAGTFDGSVSLSAQNISDLNAGLYYVNVHSQAFGGGEIRGQITAVPEPSTIALGSVAAFGMLALRRRRA